MKYLFILLIFSSCQFDSKPIILKTKTMQTNTREQIKLTTGAIYYFNSTNYLLDSFSQQSVRLKYLEEKVVKILDLPMNEFLKSNPVNFGRL